MFPQLKPKQRKSKKAVSVIIGYVLLITFAVIIGVLVYRWMKTYVPQEELNCPGETSLFIKSINYNCASNILTLTLINNGKFDIGGYFIYATDSPDKKLATIDLTKNQTESTLQMLPYGIKLKSFADKNSLGPGEEEIEIYNLTGTGRIYSVEIVPIRWQTQERKMILASCKDAKIREDISCTGACTPNCGTRNCGMDPVCGTLSCGGNCNSGYNCASNGTCMKGACTPESNVSFCAGLNKNCGSVSGTDNCLAPRTADCGNCNPPETCNATNMCHCTPNCIGKDCGSDGCYGTCGSLAGGCASGFACNSAGQCESTGGGGSSCINWCEDLGRDYQDSDCFGQRGQCTNNPLGHYEPGGNSECLANNPNLGRCCCYHEIL